MSHQRPPRVSIVGYPLPNGRGSVKIMKRLLLIALLLPAPVAAGEPIIRSLNLRGLQVGGTTAVTLDGDDFGPSPKLLLAFPAKQILKPGSTDKKATFDVTLDDAATPGYYHLRIVSGDGVSAPVVVAVDRLPQLPFAPTIDQLPAALHGNVAGGQGVETRWKGKAGDHVLVEVDAQRLGSKLRPVLHLYGPQKLQIAWAWTRSTLFGDARLEAKLPEDGEYVLSLHDLEYNPPAPSFFRLRVGTWSAIDQVFPPAIVKGKNAGIEMLGTTGTLSAKTSPTEMTGILPLDWPQKGVWAGPRPFVILSEHPEIVRDSASAQPMDVPAGLVGISAHLLTPMGEDRYRIPAPGGSKVRLEVFAERIGSPLDAGLVIRGDKGESLARNDDGPGSLDPVLEYTVPAKATSFVVGVVDAQGRAGPRAIYRLVVAPQGAKGAEIFSLMTPTQRVAVPPGGRAVLPIWIKRQGYDGPIVLRAEPLPKGVTLEGATIPADADGALVTVLGAAAGDSTIARWLGQPKSGTALPVYLKDHPLQRLQPWLATEVALGVSAPSALQYELDWAKLPADLVLMRTAKLTLPVKFNRPGKDGIVRLTLITSQQPIVLNNQPDPNKNLKAEKVVELAGKTLEGEVVVSVPIQLPGPVYDVTVQADWLTPDKKTVLATRFALVQRLTVQSPLIVTLAKNRVESAVDTKKAVTVKVEGKLQRKGDLKGDATVTIAGLPDAIKATPAIVKAVESAFSVLLTIPANTPPTELKDLKLSASAAPNPGQPNLRVTSAVLDVTLVLTKAP